MVVYDDMDDDDHVEFEDETRVHYKNDENKERGNWSGKAEFLLSLVGYCVGLGNIWRFPAKVYQNGGGAFLIPYWITALTCGVPMVFMEISLGQFTSSGPMTVWRMAPILYGVGYCSIFISFLVSIYYNMVAGYGIFYLFESFRSELQYAHCGWEPGWEGIAPYTDQFCAPYHNQGINCTREYLGREVYVEPMTGACVDQSSSDVIAYTNYTLAKENDINIIMSTEQYLYNYVFGEERKVGLKGTTYLSNLGNLGGIRWQLLLCLAAAWVFVFLCLINGIKTSGKVIYFTCIFPYVVLLVLLINGARLDGAAEGVRQYITPDWTKIQDLQVWRNAANQLFYSVAPAWGSIIALASYNRFNNWTTRDALVCVLADSLTSLFAGFTIYCYLGFYAKQLGKEVGDVVSSGNGMAFIMYPAALQSLGGTAAVAFSIIFFAMFFVIAMDSQFNMVEAILTGLLDTFPQFRRSFGRKVSFFAVLCAVMFALGIPTTTQGGDYVIRLFDDYSAGWPVFVAAVIEAVIIGWIYGAKRFTRDVLVMLPDSWSCTITVFPFFMMVWVPVYMLFMTAVGWKNWAEYGLKTIHRGYEFPLWGNLVGLAMMIIEFALVPIATAYWVIRVGFRRSFYPRPDHGPYLLKHRAQARHNYNENFIINLKADWTPKNEEKYYRSCEREKGFLVNKLFPEKYYNDYIEEPENEPGTGIGTPRISGTPRTPRAARSPRF